MSAYVELDLTDLNQGLRILVNKLRPNSTALRRSLLYTAEWILGMAQRAAPVDEGSLAASATV